MERRTIDGIRRNAIFKTRSLGFIAVPVTNVGISHAKLFVNSFFLFFFITYLFIFFFLYEETDLTGNHTCEKLRI